jgi:neutral ceramidase
MTKLKLAFALVLCSFILNPAQLATTADAAELRIGTAAAELEGDDSMVIAGGIHPRYVKGQEGKLRAVAVVLEKPASTKLAIVACDVLMMTRDQLDPVVERIEQTCGIPASHVMIHCTHTHHAPTTCRVHGYDRDEVFSKRVQEGILEAVREANAELSEATFRFHEGEEKTVGQNSRLLLSDGKIYWTGPRDDAVRPTGPFDPELPVLAFRDPAGSLRALIFNHSTHTIGALTGNFRSPAFYGLVAQQLEAELGGTVVFLEGASGSTHRLNVGTAEAVQRIKQAVLDALAQAKPDELERLAALKRPLTFKVRTFDEAAEGQAVAEYCNKRLGGRAQSVIDVFRQMRKELTPHQGEERTTWLQAMLIGDVAIVGVPAEFFTQLGVDIKRRSPFEHTYVAELSNDWIGYVGNREAYDLGGYQLWMGLHSYAEPGTGERIVEEAVEMLNELVR